MVVAWLVGIFVVLFGFVVFRGAPYVPSQKKFIRQAFSELYPLGPKDVLVDVGSGDGVVLRVASERGARAIGYEINPLLVVLSRFFSRHDPKVTVELADFWLVALPDTTTVVYAFAATPYMKKMAVKMQDEADRLGRPLRFISHGSMLHDMKAIASIGAYSLYEFHPLHASVA